MITVTCWKWKPRDGYHTKFTADHVNRLRSMVERHLHCAYEFVCVTDDPAGIDSRVRIVPLWPEISAARHPKRPNCYRRLRAFAPDAAELLGERILSIDLDCVITDDITPLAKRPEDFVIYKDLASSTPYNGSMWLLRAGTRPKVWTDFDPDKTPLQTERMGIIGSDQAAIAKALGPNEALFTKRDGVCAYMRDVRKGNGGALPAGTRIVFLIGPYDPATAPEPWAKEHYR